MKPWIAIACASLLLAVGPNVLASNAGSAPKAEYPCDVFDMSFCFRKPWNAVVTLWSGPDFHVYNVKTRDEVSLFSVYDGMTPKQQDGRVRLKQYKTNGIRVDIGTLKNTEGAKAMDILIQYPMAATCTSSVPAIRRGGMRWRTP